MKAFLLLTFWESISSWPLSSKVHHCGHANHGRLYKEVHVLNMLDDYKKNGIFKMDLK